MDVEAVRQRIMAVCGFSQLAHVLTFEGNRPTRMGEDEIVRIEIHDNGPECEYRYWAYAKNEKGQDVASNAGRTIDEALVIQWWDFKNPSGKQSPS